MAKLQGYEFYKSIGCPKYVVAPMVDGSELAFRMLCTRYGADIAYTPMINSKIFLKTPEYRRLVFDVSPKEDYPVFVQFCGHDPDLLLQAAKMVEDKVTAVDINLGCPQRIAKKGYYGAFLMDNPDLICSMVRKLDENLKVPVTCKIRIYPEKEGGLQKTLEYARQLEKSGCQLLTVHGRTREQKGIYKGLADWDVIKSVKQSLSIPVFANGNIRTLEDVQKCLEYTGCDGVMSAEGLLEYPALFSGKQYNQMDLIMEYFEIAESSILPYPAALKGHVFRQLGDLLNIHVDLRTQISNPDIKDYFKLKAIVLELKHRVENNIPPPQNVKRVKREKVESPDFFSTCEDSFLSFLD
jgi:tRNA-dihydrouridine synthase 1